VAKHKEIERRWIVSSVDRRVLREPFQIIVQGYLHNGLRVRIQNGVVATLGRKTGKGLVRIEEELPLPHETARMLLSSCYLVLKKKRIETDDGWILDVFLGNQKGLLVLEREMTAKQAKRDIICPDWAHGVIEITNTLTSRSVGVVR
jgi:CYTH domain-containing protein